VNPKYTRFHFPSSSSSEKDLLWCVVSVNGPPTCARPTVRVSCSFPVEFAGKFAARKEGKVWTHTALFEKLLFFIAKVEE
jgi:hypothetical protein